MPAQIELYDDELRELRLLLERELTAGRVELRHTDTHAFRQYVRERLDRIELMLRKVDAALPVDAAAEAPTLG